MLVYHPPCMRPSFWESFSSVFTPKPTVFPLSICVGSNTTVPSQKIGDELTAGNGGERLMTLISPQFFSWTESLAQSNRTPHVPGCFFPMLAKVLLQ